MEKLKTFSIEIPVNDPEKMDQFQEVMNQVQDAYVLYVKELAFELGVSEDCALDVTYLRTRSRHTPELEQELIRLHKNGVRPNMCDFGCQKD